jgi:hypothetical protein
VVGHLLIDKKYEARATTTIRLTAGIRESHRVLLWPNMFLYSTSAKSQKSFSVYLYHFYLHDILRKRSYTMHIPLYLNQFYH